MRHNDRCTVSTITGLFMMGCMVGTGDIALETFLGTMAAAHDESGPYAGMKKGTIDAIAEQSLRIDRNEYGITEKLEVTDQYRRPVHLKDIEKGQDIYFRLDHKSRVDKVIVIIPS
jgi:hypothetical protein